MRRVGDDGIRAEGGHLPSLPKPESGQMMPSQAARVRCRLPHGSPSLERLLSCRRGGEPIVRPPSLACRRECPLSMLALAARSFVQNATQRFHEGVPRAIFRKSGAEANVACADPLR